MAAHEAITTRRTNLEARGLDPGPDQGPELQVGPTVQQPTLYGTFVAYPDQTEAWFFPDAEHLARFQPVPGGTGAGRAPTPAPAPAGRPLGRL